MHLPVKLVAKSHFYGQKYLHFFLARVSALPEASSLPPRCDLFLAIWSTNTTILELYCTLACRLQTAAPFRWTWSQANLHEKGYCMSRRFTSSKVWSHKVHHGMKDNHIFCNLFDCMKVYAGNQSCETYRCKSPAELTK
jgi:hypothetical protein